ncbi:Nucleoside permease NupC [Paenibacillus konkukensis]|uniref:Nucleoside permease NupC n=1 Tax=Paenibacillus konkukensis TaxID=2020716 RepID=A0ABY4RJH8_9BACL|nr:Nucleoside permease NupC [Paenibacillus konkukensis]
MLGIAYLFSNGRKKIRIRPAATMIAIQLILAFVLLNTEAGIGIVSYLSLMFNKLLEMADTGIDFVFGGLENEGAFTFYLHVLLPIIFISILIGIFNYFKILPFVIKHVGRALSKINGMGRLENYIAVSTAVLGQPEVYLTVKKQLRLVSEKRLYTFCTSGMSAVSMAIVGSYMKMLEPKYVVIGVVLNILSALIVASIINPYEVKDEEDLLLLEDGEAKPAFFEMVGDSIMDGFKIACVVAAMLVGYVALMSLLNYAFTGAFHISFQTALGYVFAPIAFLMGVPMHETVHAGSIMATKIVTNEFVAMQGFQSLAASLSPKTIGILSVYLVSFANFGTIGTLIGGIKALDEKQGNQAARFGLKLLLGSTLASVISATVAGTFL